MENTTKGIPFSVNITFDYKSAAILAGAIFLGICAALIIYKKI